MCKIVIAHRKPKNAPHACTSQVSTKWVRTRTSQLATCDRTSQVMPWYFQPPCFTLIDFCDQSTFIIFSNYVYTWFPKNGPIFGVVYPKICVSYVKIELLYHLFFHECPIFDMNEEKYQVSVLCNVFTVSSLHFVKGFFRAEGYLIEIVSVSTKM